MSVLRQALRALRRDRTVTWVMVASLGCAVGVWQLAESCYRQPQATAFEGAPDLYLVELDREVAAGVTPGFEDLIALLFATLLPARDAAPLGAAAPRSLLTTLGRVAASAGGAPEELSVRFASGRLFDTFALPFRFGGPFRGDGGDFAVLDHRLNRRWFNGRNSVGAEVRVGRRAFRVVGVLDQERAIREFDAFLPAPEGLFLPIGAARELQAAPDPSQPTADPALFYSDPASAEEGYLRLWVELPGDSKRAYERFLERYAREQGGRRPRITGARLVPWAEWHAKYGGAGGIYAVFRGMGTLVLLGCALNLVRLWVMRFGARSTELGLRRALGETRRGVILRQLAEAALVGLLSGALGVAVLAASLRIFNALIHTRPLEFFLDLHGAAACLLGGLVAATVAAAYPSWRFSLLTPAALLRRQ